MLQRHASRRRGGDMNRLFLNEEVVTASPSVSQSVRPPPPWALFQQQQRLTTEGETWQIGQTIIGRTAPCTAVRVSVLRVGLTPLPPLE